MPYQVVTDVFHQEYVVDSNGQNGQEQMEQVQHNQIDTVAAASF